MYDGKNKSFFFFNFEQFRQGNLNGTTTDSVPTAAYQSGNFANAECLSYIGGAVGATGGTCTPWPAVAPIASDQLGSRPGGNPACLWPNLRPLLHPSRQRPAGSHSFPEQHDSGYRRMDKVALAIQSLLPQANAPGIINNYNVPAYTSFEHTTNVSIKLDHSISPTIKISGYYSQLNTYTPNVNGGIQPLALGGANGNNWNHTSRLNYDQTITPTLLFHVGVGYFETSEPHVAPPFSQASLGLSGYQANNIMPDIGGIYSCAGRL